MSAYSARYRSGTPGPGEIAVRGPRVLTAEGMPGGEVVAAVDEAIRYTPRKAGYHGGASAAEVVVPVIALLPSASQGGHLSAKQSLKRNVVAKEFAAEIDALYA